MGTELRAHLEDVRSSVVDRLPASPCLTPGGVHSLRRRLAGRLAPTSAGLRPRVEVVVDRYHLRSAVCPASGVDEPFEWTAALAARSLGRRALRQMLGAGKLGVLDAVEVAIDESIAEEGFAGKWLRGQDGPTRGATVVAAASWASRAWVAVPWARLGTVHLSERATWAKPLGSASSIVVKGRPDAVIRPVGRGASELVLLSLGAAVGGADLDLLGFALFRGFVPLRVVSVQPSSGVVSAADVSVGMLEVAADAVVAVVTALVRAGEGGAVAEVPGGQCRSCARRDRCCSGSAWLAGQGRRVGGIPVAPT